MSGLRREKGSKSELLEFLSSREPKAKKRGYSFYISKPTHDAFHKKCEGLGLSASAVLERLLRDFVADKSIK